MNIKYHNIDKVTIAELVTEDVIIKTVEDGLDLLGNVYFQGADRVIIHKTNITSEFFDLKTGIAGEILQKFSNYRVRLAIVGDFSKLKSQSLNDFIVESNKGKQINFVVLKETA